MLLQDAGSATAAVPESVIVRPELFFGEWTYVEHATLAGGEVRLLFNLDTRNAVQFDAEFEWIDPSSGASTQTNASIRALGYITVPVPSGFQDRAVRLTVRLDEALAFSAMLAPVPSGTIILPR